MSSIQGGSPLSGSPLSDLNGRVPFGNNSQNSQLGNAGANKHRVDSSHKFYENKENKSYAKVHVWEMNHEEGRCGHVALELIRKNSGEARQSSYLGLWPRFAGSVSLFTLPVPVPGTNSQSSLSCSQRESGDDMEPLLPSDEIKVYLTDDQYNAMKEKMDSENKAIENGLVSYCLTPKISFLNFLNFFTQKDVVDMQHSCPITELPMEHPLIMKDLQGINNLRSENCSTVATNILKAGGISVEQSRFAPWGVTPTSVGAQLQQQAKTNARFVHKKISNENVHE